MIVEKAPLVVLSLADGIVTILTQRSANAIVSTGNLPFSERARNFIAGYSWYLWKTVCPTELCAFYPLPGNGPSWPMVGLSALVLGAISVFVIAGRSRGHLVFAVLGQIALLPVSGLVQAGGQAYADRYAYIPHIGLLTLVVWEVRHWLKQRPSARWLVAIGVAAVTICFAALAWRQSTYRAQQRGIVVARSN